MNRTVTASEVAEWVFCPESFRLAALGHDSANRPEREAGTKHHAEKATAEQIAGGSIALGRILIAVALLMFAIWWFLR